MSKVRSSSIRIVPDAPCVPCVNSELPHAEKRPQRNAVVSAEKRAAAKLAHYVEPRIRRALAGERPEPVTVEWVRKGFKDGVRISVQIEPVRT